MAPTMRLLPSARVRVQTNKNKTVICRALLDTCSTANFITEKLAQELNLPMKPYALAIGGINSTNTFSKHIVTLNIRALHNDFSKSLTFLTLPTITDLTPSEVFPRQELTLPRNIKLADPEFHLPKPVDMLIGSSPTLSLLSIGQITLTSGKMDVMLQKTNLGWIVAGGLSHQPAITAICRSEELEKSVEKFWTTEELPIRSPRSKEETDCESFFTRTTIRNEVGRYIVRLPFREQPNTLGNSYNTALGRLKSLQRKLNLDLTLKDEYDKILQEYVNLGHMSPVDDHDHDGFYLPHHAVIKTTSATTKVRVVFDASARSDNGRSLNDILMVGPVIQDKLFELLIRFRVHKYVITADIEKMYRQVMVHEDDRKFQRILWYKNGHQQTYQLNTVTFGVTTAPFLAIRVIHQLADDECGSYPTAAKIIKRDMYVDDLLTGADTLDDTRRLRDDIIKLLQRGGFHIRQWAANDSQLTNDLSNTTVNINLLLDENESLKTLGIFWNPQEDIIQYTAKSIRTDSKVTKRTILSTVAKIFDPLGLLGPIILYAKRIIQELWRHKLDWDESVPASIHTMWSEFVSEFECLHDVSVDRRLLIDNPVDIQLHGFCDASNVGYGACLYVYSVNQSGQRHVQLLCAKSRVAPLKSTTIPRLELNGALLLARLYKETCGALNVSYSQTTFWSDSTIVLHWLKMPPHRMKVYVANRINEIQEITETVTWRHIRSEDNPADPLSRGQLPSALLKNKLWFNGPTWLLESEDNWPQIPETLQEIPELKKESCLHVTVYDSHFFKKFSSYSKLLRIMAYCFRLCNRSTQRYQGLLCLKEIAEIETRILKVVQATAFSREIRDISKGVSNAKLAPLNPLIDESGLLRVGGRLKSINLPFERKHPLLLPTDHVVTNLIIKEIHEKHHHSGIQTTLYHLRQKFWIFDGRNQVRRIIRRCIRCFRFNASSINYKMGNLPAVRLTSARPFANTGIDFCGPFFVKEKRFRNTKRIKVYICVFVCMVVKAVHLEVVSDLTTEGFLAALRRFIARRGAVRHIYSDNGTNFVGANNKLKELYALLNSNQHKEKVNHYALDQKIIWHFNPPATPHFGGLWEATVKLFKHHVKRVVGDSLFTFEELNTFVIEVEGILNSRPLTPISSDPNDPLVLTPSHCLIGESLSGLPENDISSVPKNRLNSWLHIIQVRQHFWKRWHLEYLNELQKRHKWTKGGENLQKSTIVLIKEKNLPCLRWALGVITDVHPGEDGIVRTATVKTANGTIKRSTRLLCPLPVQDGADNHN